VGTRRSNSEGSIVKRADGRWMARLTLDDGTRKTWYARTRQEAAQLLKAAIRDRDNGLPVVTARQSVGEYLESWLQATKHSVKPRTWRRRGEYIRLHAIPAIGNVPLIKLNAQHLQALYTQKLDEGLSPTTVHHLHAVLHRALNAAMRLGLVQRNVTELVDAPRMARREIETFSPDEARRFLAAVKRERFEALYVLALSTGMRQGELLALRWRDVDLEASTLRVTATLQYTPDGYVFAEPKTSYSRRLVALSPIAVDALRQHKARQEEERARIGSAWRDLDLVFPNTVGKPMDGIHLLQREYLPLLERAGLRRIRFHDLRHTAATVLLASGVHLKVVSEMLGHADVVITLKLYSHVLPHMQRDAAAAMEATLRGDMGD